MRKLFTVTMAILVLAALYASSIYNYLLFHSLAEIFSIIIACGTFMVAWNCRRFLNNQYLLFIGIAYLFIGALDLAHTLSYKGMPILIGYGANAPTQLWIAARYMESLTLLAAPLMFRRHIRPVYFILGYSVVVTLLLLSIFYWRCFPDCFLAEAGGLTRFKKASEYVISAFFVTSGALIVRCRQRFDPVVLRWLLVSIALKILSELAFTTYANVYGAANLLGHYFKIASFYCVYKAIIETGLAKPYELLFRDLSQSETRFKLLSATSGRLLATENPQGIVNELCQAVMEHLDCQAFFNFLVDEASGQLHLNACAGIPTEKVSKIQWLDYGVAVSGCVARDRERIIAEDIRTSSDPRTETVRSYGIQAYCCHPLVVQGGLIGTLSFGTKVRPRFKTEDVELMRTVADQVALAMQRIQAREALRNANQALEDKVRKRTAALARTVDTLEEEVKLRQRAESELHQANNELAGQADQLRKLTCQLTMAEQRERMRLSQILHDGLQQYLAIAKLQLSSISDQTDSDDIKQTAREIEAMIAESIQMSRSLTAELSPPVLYEGDLVAGLKWLARWMQEKHAFRVELSMDATACLPVDVKILVFESVRELLFNAVKHAEVSGARVHLKRMPGTGVRISVEDAGVGFDIHRLKPMGHDGGCFGLFSIRERLGLIGGHFEIDSSPGTGSRFTLSLPYGSTLS
jgi:signal transduction histidine kinase